MKTLLLISSLLALTISCGRDKNNNENIVMEEINTGVSGTTSRIQTEVMDEKDLEVKVTRAMEFPGFEDKDKLDLYIELINDYQVRFISKSTAFSDANVTCRKPFNPTITPHHTRFDTHGEEAELSISVKLDKDSVNYECKIGQAHSDLIVKKFTLKKSVVLSGHNSIEKISHRDLETLILMNAKVMSRDLELKITASEIYSLDSTFINFTETEVRTLSLSNGSGLKGGIIFIEALRASGEFKFILNGTNGLDIPNHERPSPMDQIPGQNANQDQAGHQGYKGHQGFPGKNGGSAGKLFFKVKNSDGLVFSLTNIPGLGGAGGRGGDGGVGGAGGQGSTYRVHIVHGGGPHGGGGVDRYVHRQHPNGPQGPQGPVGDQGISGSTGTVQQSEVIFGNKETKIIDSQFETTEEAF